MKTSRRIEVTAFRRRVTIAAHDGGEQIEERNETSMTDLNTDEEIAIGSDEGQRILVETVRLLDEKILDKKR